MKKLYNRFNVKTNSYEFSTGSSGVIISSSDMQSILASIVLEDKTTPLDVAHLYAKEQFGDTNHSLKEFEKMLKPFMYNKLIATSPSIDTKILVKYHLNLVNALDDVTDCVFKYLTRNKVKDICLHHYMTDKVKRDTFRRRYRRFILGIIQDLETRVNNLEWLIFRKVLENNTN